VFGQEANESILCVLSVKSHEKGTQERPQITNRWPASQSNERFDMLSKLTKMDCKSFHEKLILDHCICRLASFFVANRGGTAHANPGPGTPSLKQRLTHTHARTRARPHAHEHEHTTVHTQMQTRTNAKPHILRFLHNDRDARTPH